MKLFFTDMDGTLLNDEKQIPARNKQAIQKILSKGHGFIICSGRSRASIAPFIEELGLNQKGCYAILYNGGSILDCYTGKFLYQNTIPLDYVRHIFKEARAFGLHCQTYEGDYVLTERDSPELQQYKWSSKMEVKIDPDLVWHLKEEPIKILTSSLSDRPHHEAYRAHMEAWAKGKISIFFSGPYYLEHVMEGVSKGAAIRALCDYLHLPLSCTVSIGDAENDISMLNTTFFSVCMKNGTEEAKKHSNYITSLDNNQGGVAEVLEKFISLSC